MLLSCYGGSGDYLDCGTGWLAFLVAQRLKHLPTMRETQV